MKMPSLSHLLVISLFASPLAAWAQDDEILYQEKLVSEVDGWTVTSISQKGKMQHAMIERSYDDGSVLRYFLGKTVSTFMFYDSNAFESFNTDTYREPISYSFSGYKGGDSAVFEATAGVGDGLTNSQDAYIRTDVGNNAEFLTMLAASASLSVKIGKFSRKFDLKGSGKAAEALRKVVGLAPKVETAKVPAGSESAPKGKVASSEGERVVLSTKTPSVVWDLSLNGGETKVYQIQGKRGQKAKLSFIEDTREGQMDVGKASVEEGLENGATLTFSENGSKRVDVSNPSSKRMDFRIYLSLE